MARIDLRVENIDIVRSQDVLLNSDIFRYLCIIYVQVLPCYLGNASHLAKNQLNNISPEPDTDKLGVVAAWPPILPSTNAVIKCKIMNACLQNLVGLQPGPAKKIKLIPNFPTLPQPQTKILVTDLLSPTWMSMCAPGWIR